MPVADLLFQIVIAAILTGTIGKPSNIIIGILCVVFIAMNLTGRALLLKKVGKSPLRALVPFVSDYEIFDIAWYGNYGFIYRVLEILFLLSIPVDGKPLSNLLNGTVMIILFIAAMILSSIMKLKLVRSFNKGAVIGFGLIVMEDLFLLILARYKTSYYGKTLQIYNDEPGKPIKRRKTVRHYLINLSNRHSWVALIASTTVVVSSLLAVAGGLMEIPSEITPERGGQLYHLFTVNSNTLAAFAAALIIPYAIEGIRNKQFTMPKWVAVVEYASVNCTTLTMIFAVLFILPALGIEVAFMGMNFWLHLVCPVMALILFYSVESYHHMSIEDSLVALFPFYIYAVVYIFNVVLLGEENGGWRDIYRLVSYLPASITAPAMFMMGFGISSLLRYVYNYFSDRRHSRFVESLKQELDPVAVKVEVMGLGTYKGAHNDYDSINLPLTIFHELSELTNIPVKEMIPVYGYGVSDGISLRNTKFNIFRQNLYNLIGTPEKLSRKYLEAHPEEKPQQL